MEDDILYEELKDEQCRDFNIVNCDTDSISFCKSDGKQFTIEEQEMLMDEINSLLPEKIIYEDDGSFKTVLVVKAKNYVLVPYKKKDGIKIKGSGLKASMKEIALKEFIGDIINALITKKKAHLFAIYNIYAQEVIQDGLDISRWTSKKTVTDAVLNPSRSTEEKLLAAIEGKGLSQGDKFFVYFKEDESVACKEDYDNDHSVTKLLEKIYKTLKIFENVIDMDCYPNYKNKGNRKLLGL